MRKRKIKHHVYADILDITKQRRIMRMVKRPTVSRKKTLIKKTPVTTRRPRLTGFVKEYDLLMESTIRIGQVVEHIVINNLHDEYKKRTLNGTIDSWMYPYGFENPHYMGLDKKLSNTLTREDVEWVQNALDTHIYG